MVVDGTLVRGTLPPLPDGSYELFFNQLFDSIGHRIAGQEATRFSIGNTNDLDGNGTVDAKDIDLLCLEIRNDSNSSMFDLNGDGKVDHGDYTLLMSQIGALPGDANLDGSFDSRDLVAVFQSAEYEDQVTGNSGWADGDWNCDGDFTTGDLVAAFESGQYSAAASRHHRYSWEVASAIQALFPNAAEKHATTDEPK